MKEIIIVGAGAAGLFLAAQLSESESVLILEKMPQSGLKLLVSGSGSCNLTHTGYVSEFVKHYHAPKNYVKKVLKSFDNQAVIDYFQSIGLETYTREDGKVFPKSMQSREVRDALLKQIPHAIHYGESVETIVKTDKGFKVTTHQASYESKTVVIATGGMSYAALGSDGSGYGLAKRLGHLIRRPYPGLTGLILKDNPFKALMGLSFKAIKVKSVIESKTYGGDLVMTHFGISGPVVINNSCFFESGQSLELQFTPENYDQLLEHFLKESQTSGDKPLAFWLNQVNVPQRLKEHILQEMTLDSQKKLAEISKAERKNLLDKLSRYPVIIESPQGFKHAMVTCGGVAIDEIEPATMMSKCQENLYFIGEVMDVDGETGGYNLQWAFSTAMQVAKALSNKQ